MKKVFLLIVHAIAIILLIICITIRANSKEDNPKEENPVISSSGTTSEEVIESLEYNFTIDNFNTNNIGEIITKLKEKNNARTDIYSSFIGQISIVDNQIYYLYIDYTYQRNDYYMYGVLEYNYEDGIFYGVEELADAKPIMWERLDYLFGAIESSTALIKDSVSTISFTGAYLTGIDANSYVYENGTLFKTDTDINEKYSILSYYSDQNDEALFKIYIR